MTFGLRRLRGLVLAGENFAYMNKVVHGEEVYENFPPLVFLFNPHAGSELFGKLSLKQKQFRR